MVRSSHDLKIGHSQFASVELPGRVRDLNNALNCIGGEQAVGKALSLCGDDRDGSVPGCLRVNLRPDDPFSAPIDATVSNNTTFLMEVRRQSDGTLQPRILGRVRKTARFLSLADFQIVHKTPFMKEMQLLPPVSLSNISAPRDYRFRPSQTGETRRKRLESRLADHHNRFSRFALIPFDAPDVPSGPEPNSFSASEAARQHPVTLLIQDLFDKRPVISKRLLLHTMRLVNQDRRSVIRYVYCVAYRFSGGPWRGLWCRYGYDPRKDPGSLRYQCIDIRIREDFISKVAERRQQQQAEMVASRTKKNETGSKKVFNGLNPAHPDVTLVVLPSDIDFSAPPQQSFILYQLCDLSGVDLQAIVKNAAPTSACDRKTGWAHERDLAEIRAIMKRRVSTWMSMAPFQADVDGTRQRDWNQMLHDSAERLAASSSVNDCQDGFRKGAGDIDDGIEFDSDEYSSLDEFEIFD